MEGVMKLLIIQTKNRGIRIFHPEQKVKAQLWALMCKTKIYEVKI